MTSLWTMGEQGTAVGLREPVIADGELFAELVPIWSDDDGVRVSIDWTLDVWNGVTRLEDLSGAQAQALADALVRCAETPAPQRRER